MRVKNRRRADLWVGKGVEGIENTKDLKRYGVEGEKGGRGVRW
jgi:hypothetical protein